MFRAAHRSSSGALNCVCSLWFIYPCGDRQLPRQRPVLYKWLVLMNKVRNMQVSYS